ncbi:MAG: phage portal protein [Armatimonadota bacterium]|nr:phage portal protein [bacterium]
MSLPTNNQKWPPESWRTVYDIYAEHAAWYGSDLDTLASIYAQRIYSPYHEQTFAIADHLRNEMRDLVHVPAAADISNISAAMLFGEHPKIKIKEAQEENASAEAKAAQEALDDIVNKCGLYSVFSEAADTASGMGGVFLKVNWNKDLSQYPIIDVAQVDNALPEFHFGFLRAVTFWKELETDGNTVYRLLERHESGVILNGLYRGTPGNLGEQIGLTSRADTADISPQIETGLDSLACVYIPNMRPNRRFRGLRLGQSDYAASESLMLSLDDIFTSLLRDIKLGMGRIIAPEEFFDHDSDGQKRFDVFRQAYLKVDAIQGGSAANDNIKVSQFAIRTQEHIDSALALLRQIYTSAGYSPQTFGLDINGTAESGTALTIRERKSFITTAKKADYWRPALEYILWAAQVIYKTKLDGKITPYKSTVEMQDSVQTDIGQIANSVKLLSDAQSASIETRVRMVHPDWSVEQVKTEVQAILDEQGANVPDPTTLGRGDSENDEEAE